MIDIRQELKDKGVAQLDIARMLKIKASSVHNVITGKRRTPRIRAAIAMAISKPVAEIWPELKADSTRTSENHKALNVSN